MAVPRTRPGNYPSILSYGFRPFFLLGSLYAGLTILFWLPLLYGHLETSSVFSPVDWHVHEMLFGYPAAIVTGFLLTAIPNWTGRLPVQGLPLLALVLLWFAGRAAVFFSAETGWLAAAVIDCAFLLAVAGAAATEIVAGRNWRNLKVLAPVLVLLAANMIFHAEAHFEDISDIGRRLGIGAAVVLITIIGGRIIPSFTRNWLVRENPGRLPAPFGRFDAATIVTSALALALWSLLPERTETGLALLVSAALNAFRLSRWAGDRTSGDPLVLILHVAYAFVPLGMLLAALPNLMPGTVAPAAGIHAFGVGAIGTMTLAVMVRATLGHTGRQLRAGKAGCFVFVAILVAAAARIAQALGVPGDWLIHLAACAWVAAFLGFAVLYGGMLLLRGSRVAPPTSGAKIQAVSTADTPADRLRLRNERAAWMI
ncbi:NnrS family protein [Aminobacter carboxidus]|uniref:NnrS family protein n=1 Tax=Aminobacter carboxidus TaxID=376165 RepID=A0ABR9GQZ7_9HYPH|nr:NnrS family protein [Aminobacter carboxidus]MBE1206092.1 NnrS family protein [Aminobacter carboxidus]